MYDLTVLILILCVIRCPAINHFVQGYKILLVKFVQDVQNGNHSNGVWFRKLWQTIGLYLVWIYEYRYRKHHKLYKEIKMIIIGNWNLFYSDHNYLLYSFE